MLKDALIRIAGAADIVGARAVLVHAIDTEAAAFYRRFNFEPSPANDLYLMLLMKDLRMGAAAMIRMRSKIAFTSFQNFHYARSTNPKPIKACVL